MIIRLIKMKRLWIGLALALCWSLIALPTLAQKPGDIGQAATETATPTWGGAWHGYILIQWSPDLPGAITERGSYLGPPHPYCDIDLGCIPTEAPPVPPELDGVLRLLGPEHSDWPPYVVSVRYNLDNSAAIVEARFDVMPTQESVLNLISERAYNMPHAEMGAITVTIFGVEDGTTIPSWEQSWEACLAYIAAHNAEWEPPIQ